VGSDSDDFAYSIPLFTIIPRFPKKEKNQKEHILKILSYNHPIRGAETERNDFQVVIDRK
jgi:hypothetical protein